MHATLYIHPTETTDEGFAVVQLIESGTQRLCQLDLQYSQLALLPRPRPEAVDFLLLAASVYALDKLVLRSSSSDAWTRELSLTLPVADPAVWQPVQADLNTCLSFLTGDIWHVSFEARRSNPIRPLRLRRRRRRRRPIAFPSGDAVSLFSGGLDSLIGVIDWLEQPPPRSLLLVGHHDGQMAGPYADQRALREPIRQHYPTRVKSLLTRVGHGGEQVEQTEITLRGRSLIFIGLGVFAASALGPNVPLLIPENGTMALNVPLTPSRRGSCSTRTAHPHYLNMLGRILAQVGLSNPLSNPLQDKTKGEAVVQCRNRVLLNALARLSVSCAKRGHKVHWTRREAKSCGRCMPCIYRRAAMHAAGWDAEVYGDDVCTGEVRVDDAGEKANDLRACLSFLKKHPGDAEVARMLMASGRLDPRRLPDYSALVGRAMDEIRELLRAKGTPEVRRLAGLP
jgi:hypothetical protein